MMSPYRYRQYDSKLSFFIFKEQSFVWAQPKATNGSACFDAWRIAPTVMATRLNRLNTGRGGSGESWPVSHAGGVKPIESGVRLTKVDASRLTLQRASGSWDVSLSQNPVI
jgi:hypothetical protein